MSAALELSADRFDAVLGAGRGSGRVDADAVDLDELGPAELPHATLDSGYGLLQACFASPDAIYVIASQLRVNHIALRVGGVLVRGQGGAYAPRDAPDVRRVRDRGAAPGAAGDEVVPLKAYEKAVAAVIAAANAWVSDELIDEVLRAERRARYEQALARIEQAQAQTAAARAECAALLAQARAQRR